ncbi:Major facilitator superfamily domain-containing protein 10 [Penicillium cosmopolitanum]|uniref:Major facilitator superfamily domain-containing protein 10 n=1 Tax=Penicillium cosmopolitanum TaxID=1131564 RepID=A0A9X0BEN2_9EURO|nr:Major facilitator superfamily domain-containing protein 10 [Penicillium cosmopolitanum]KAJ5414407.1 Major facilitator superfamily domain-containing protein 10 [Penicillium cosmopolitanum]
MAIAGAQRKQVLKVLMISLLLDLISFTFILPLFPSLLTFYRIQDTSSTSKTSLLTKILHYLNAYKNAFALPIDSRYDIVLLGGALGSLFSLLQAIAAPIIGHLSDRHGRRRALLISMIGNIASVALWVSAKDFRTFLASRVVGGLSEANVQLADAIVGDVTDEAGRSGCMALIGACFSVAFTVGPVLGAALGSVDVVKDNPFFVAAGVSLGFVVVETGFIWAFLPETHPRFTLLEKEESRPSAGEKKGEVKKQKQKQKNSKEPTHIHTNNPAILNALHFLFLLPFAGLEFSLPFFTATLYADTTSSSSSSPAALNGRLLSLMGLIASLLQGTVVRRLPPLTTIRIGVIACAISFFLLARVETVAGLYAAGGLLAVTSATVVTGLKSLGSFEARDLDRGAVMGRLRGWGQAGRATGPVLFCSLFWWAGREVAYSVGGVAMVVVAGAVFLLLKAPVVRGKVD